MAAAGRGHIEVVRLLIERGVNVNAKKREDAGTPILIAAQEGQTDVVKLLHKHGAKIDVVTLDGTTIVHRAAQNGHMETVKAVLLLASECTDEAEATRHKTAKHAPTKAPSFVKWLVNEPRADDGTTPAFFASQNGHLETVKLLQKWGADFGIATLDDGQTPVFTASNQGRLDVVQFLANHGCNLNAAATDDGATPMYAAALQGHTKVVRFLADNGAAVDTPLTTDATSPVFVASFEGHTEVVRILCEHGADVNRRRTSDGIVPLAGACLHGYLATAQLLTAFGARIDAVDSHGFTLAQITNELEPRPVFLQWVLALQANKVSNGIEACAINRMPDVAKWLLTNTSGGGGNVRNSCNRGRGGLPKKGGARNRRPATGGGENSSGGDGGGGGGGGGADDIDLPSSTEDADADEAGDVTGVASLVGIELQTPGRYASLAGLHDPWPGAPDGVATRKLFKLCLYWWPTSHTLFTNEFKGVVVTVLHVAERLVRLVEEEEEENKEEEKEEEEGEEMLALPDHRDGSDEGGTRGTGRKANATGTTGTESGATPALLPVMPPEMWLRVLSFLQRCWWA